MGEWKFQERNRRLPEILTSSSLDFYQVYFYVLLLECQAIMRLADTVLIFEEHQELLLDHTSKCRILLVMLDPFVKN